MKSLKELSENAQKLHAFLGKTGGASEGQCLEFIFNKPEYPTTNDRQGRITFWQWEANAYGTVHHRPVFLYLNGSYESMKFIPTADPDYRTQISNAYQELKKNGLAQEKNNGYNSYFFFQTDAREELAK